MATTVLRTAAFKAPPIGVSTNQNSSPNFVCVPFKPRRQACPKSYRINYYSPHFSHKLSPHHLLLLLNSACFASSGETTETQEVEEIQDSQLEDNSDSTAGVEDGESEGDTTDVDEPASAIIAALRSYKESLTSNNESKVAEIEALLKSIEDEKIALESKVASLSEEMSYERDRVLRISADFDNFRKRTERERLSLVTNAKGEVVENLLPVLDNFERAKAQIKVETVGEEKISNSYQSIYKQFVEILGSLGVVPVVTIGNPFDPMASSGVGSKFSRVLNELFQMLNKLHEAIMREDSAEFEEGIVLQEFRKGFKLGDRLLRPSMVKVSAGPGPAKSESVESSEDPEGVSETEEEGSSEPAAVED